MSRLFEIQFDPTCDQTITFGVSAALRGETITVPYTERRHYRVKLENGQWSSPVSPRELTRILEQEGPVRQDPNISLVTALKTSALFNYRRGESRQAGTPAVARRVPTSSPVLKKAEEAKRKARLRAMSVDEIFAEILK